MQLRLKNRFGKRYISAKELLDYAWDLDLFVDHPPSHLPEFLERCDLLTPVARIRFPAEVVRRWHKDRYPSENVPPPIEGDTPRLAAASALHDEIYSNLWSRSDIYGERAHLVDEVSSEHAPFIQTDFDKVAFVPWKEFRTVIAIQDGKEVGDGGDGVRTCYHYWQVFALAAILRSGVTILYDLSDDALFEELWSLKISDASRAKLRATLNLEARHELAAIKKHTQLFDAVAYFIAYRQNAFQSHLQHLDGHTRKLPHQRFLAYKKRQREIASDTLTRFKLKPRHVLQFVKFQCELWEAARDRSPANVADDLRHNIDGTIDLYQLVTRTSFSSVVEKVGRRGQRNPILKVIFPDWQEEQRALAERSLSGWILPTMAGLPAPFAVAAQDVEFFCDWVDEHQMIQLYWHFKRLLDLGLGDGPITRSATAVEAVSFANTVEFMANTILTARGQSPRGATLAAKIRSIIQPASPVLVSLLVKFKDLTKTEDATLRQRISQIDRIKQGGADATVLRTLLKLIVIRNEGSHLGLEGFDRKAIYKLLEALVQASLLLWKVR